MSANKKVYRTYRLYSFDPYATTVLTTRRGDIGDFAPAWTFTVEARSIRQAFFVARNLIWQTHPGTPGISRIEKDPWIWDQEDQMWYPDQRSEMERQAAGFLILGPCAPVQL